MSNVQVTYTVQWRPVNYGRWMNVCTTQTSHVAKRRASELQARWGGELRTLTEPAKVTKR